VEFVQLIAEFNDELKSIARELKRRKVPGTSASGDDGTYVFGWIVEAEDFPHEEDIDINRIPIYLGGSWGHSHLILGEDGILYEEVFRGSDVYEGGDIKTTTSTHVAPANLATYVGEDEPFKAIRKKVQAAAMRAMLR